MNEKMTTAEKLKVLRNAFGMTQDEMAELLGMSRTSFSKYENGAAFPSLDVLRKLAKLYSVSLEYLVYDSETHVVLREATTKDEPDPDNLAAYFAQLTPEERMIIMKFRLMQPDEKNDFISKLEKDKDKK